MCYVALCRSEVMGNMYTAKTRKQTMGSYLFVCIRILKPRIFIHRKSETVSNNVTFKFSHGIQISAILKKIFFPTLVEI